MFLHVLQKGIANAHNKDLASNPSIMGEELSEVREVSVFKHCSLPWIS